MAIGLYNFPWSLLAGEDAQWRRGFAGEPIAAGQVVYFYPIDRRFYLASSSTPRASEAMVYGFALDSALIAGQSLLVLTEGSFTIGLSPITPPEFLQGMPYMLHGGPGQIVAVMDQAPDTFSTVVGVARNTNKFLVYRQASSILLDL